MPVSRSKYSSNGIAVSRSLDNSARWIFPGFGRVVGCEPSALEYPVAAWVDSQPQAYATLDPARRS